MYPAAMTRRETGVVSEGKGKGQRAKGREIVESA
jgi:hypothetical protein